MMMSGLGMNLQPKQKFVKGRGNKGMWAQHQGSDAESVKAAILLERPDLQVQIVPHDGKYIIIK